MANRIIIRHGSTPPTNQNLLPYELGWDGTALYINNKKNNTDNVMIAALPITGGTLTGILTLQNNGQYPIIRFKPPHSTNDGGSSTYGPSSIFINAGGTDTITYNGFYFRCYSPSTSSGSTTYTNYWEQFALPSINIGRTTNATYYILTTKEAVAINQGGTGATSAGSAANNLISGLPTWTANPNDDTYFIRQDTSGSDAFGRVKASTIYNYIKEKTDSLYLPLIGGTLTGNLTISGTGLGIYAYDTQSKAKVALQVGSGHQNHGIYSYGYSPTTTTFTSDTKWLLYRGSDGNTFIPGALYIGTATDSLSKIYAARARLTATTDASGTAANNVALIIGSETGSHLEFDNNEILMKNDGTTPGTLYLQDSTGTVDVAGSGGLKISNGPLTVSGATTANGNITIEKTTPILTIKNTASSVNVSAYFEIASSGNHGIYSSGYVGTSSAKWIIYRNGSDGLMYIPWGTSGNIVLSDTCKRIFTATSATKPSAAVAGDIVLVKA